MEKKNSQILLLGSLAGDGFVVRYGNRSRRGSGLIWATSSGNSDANGGDNGTEGAVYGGFEVVSR